MVITHDRADELRRTLDCLHALPERPPVVVVDNGSVDGTAELVASRYPSVQLLQPGTNLGAAGRNVGVEEMDRPYVAFCDDDTWWEPGSLGAAANLLDAHPRLGVVTARILVEPGGAEDPVCRDMRDSPLPRPEGLPGHPLLSFLAGASVVRRDAFMEVGGFEPQFFLGGEEELLAVDLAVAGWAMAYVPELAIHHQASDRRDAHRRRRLGIRNTLWFTWMRRPPASAMRRTLGLLRAIPRDRHSALGLVDATRGLPWVVRHRRVVPHEVESRLRLLDHPQLHSGARRYVS